MVFYFTCSPMSEDYFSYPSYGLLTSRKFSAAAWSSKTPLKTASYTYFCAIIFINRRDPNNFTYRQGRAQKKTRICIHAEPYWDNEKNWWFGKFCQKFNFKIFEIIFQKFLEKDLERLWEIFYVVFGHNFFHEFFSWNFQDFWRPKILSTWHKIWCVLSTANRMGTHHAF